MESIGLTLWDVDLGNKIFNTAHQLQRTANMKLVAESTKTNVGTRKLPMTGDVFRCFQTIIEGREEPKFEKRVDEYTGFEMLLVAMYWECRFNHMVKRYNDIYRVQMPNITPYM